MIFRMFSCNRFLQPFQLFQELQQFLHLFIQTIIEVTYFEKHHHNIQIVERNSFSPMSLASSQIFTMASHCGLLTTILSVSSFCFFLINVEFIIPFTSYIWKSIPALKIHVLFYFPFMIKILAKYLFFLKRSAIVWTCCRMVFILFSSVLIYLTFGRHYILLISPCILQL